MPTSDAMNHCCVGTHASSLGSRLPVELICHIVHYAALPNFTPKRNVNPYACALALCLVSSAMRHIAMPILLHTIVLDFEDAVTKFMQALRIQKDYASCGHSFFIDYTHYARRVWIGEGFVYSPLRQTSVASLWEHFLGIHVGIDVSLLAPVILGVPSLAIDSQNVSLLCDCLKWALQNSDVDPSLPSSSVTPTKLPWRTTTLTLSGNSFLGWDPLTESLEGSIFVAHIPSLVLPGPGGISDPFFVCSRWDNFTSRAHQVPPWAWDAIPWSSFHALHNVTLSLPKDRKALHRERLYSSKLIPLPEHIDAKMLTVEAPSMKDHAHVTTQDWVQEGLRAYADKGKGTVTDVKLGIQINSYDHIVFDWENCWASGYIG